ncbi:MAG TPA: hypothetical protein VMV09_05110 [Candidatus Saccharimonadales bacterium]|nr:hypothetical protein [Candidatus Saccharimonadales bacterium]
MIEAELDLVTAEAQRCPDDLDQVSLLSGLLTNRLFRRYRFADGGPPPTSQPEIRAGSVEVHPGWVVLGSETPDGVYGVVFTDGPNSYSQGGVIGNIPSIAAGDLTTDVYGDLSPESACARRQADALA